MVAAFSTTSVTGCLSTGTLVPLGSTGVGGVMFTPGIGPATVGLSGFALFIASQPAAASRRGDNTSRTLNFLDIVRLSA